VAVEEIAERPVVAKQFHGKNEKSPFRTGFCKF